MTDELDPTTERSTLEDDATTKVPTTPAAPLTPASRTSSTPPTYEHEVAWTSAAAPASAVVSTAPPRRRRRARWAIGAAVIAIVLGTSAGVAALITGQSSASTVLGYAPAGTLVYGEVRLDLPGDQRRAVGEFLSKFPGFADQAALDTKLDEALDELVKSASKGDQSYTANIKPWFDGELAFSVGPLPPGSSLTNGDLSAMGSFRGLALLSIKDAVGAQAWFDAAIAKSGEKTTTEAYNGTTLTVFAETGGVKAALAIVDGKVAVAGDIASVKAAVDTKGASTFASESGPKAAIDSATSDHVGFMYVGLRPLLDWSNDVSKSLPAPSGIGASSLGAAMLKAVPDWGAFWLRLEGDAVVLEAIAPKPETAIGPTENRTSAIVEHIPASAMVASISNDYGKTLKQAFDLYKAEPSLKPMLDQLEAALGLVGGADGALGWAGDSAVVINVADGTPEAGLLVAPTDKATADRLFTTLRSLIALGGAQQGITIRDETYNGTTITIVDAGALSRLLGPTGAAPGSFPMPTGNLEIAYAVTDKVVVIGSGSAFVKHVLDTTNATSLASSDRYRKLADRAGNGIGTTYVDITAIRELIEKAAADGTADATALAKYQTDVKPFLTPFDALVASGSVNGDLTRSVIFITVK